MIYSLKYTNDLPYNKAGVTSYCFWPHIEIRTEYKGDRGLLQHELEHVRQYWTRGLIIHSLRYKYSQSYRLRCEVEAYKIQQEYTSIDMFEKYANMICNDYELDVDRAEIIEMLKEL